MAKKRSPKKPKPDKPDKPDKLKPTVERSEPEKVKIGPLDPPPPKDGGGTTTGDDYQGT